MLSDDDTDYVKEKNFTFNRMSIGEQTEHVTEILNDWEINKNLDKYFSLCHLVSWGMLIPENFLQKFESELENSLRNNPARVKQMKESLKYVRSVHPKYTPQIWFSPSEQDFSGTLHRHVPIRFSFVSSCLRDISEISPSHISHMYTLFPQG